MNNFDLHEHAQYLADTRSAYSLARELIRLREAFYAKKVSNDGPSTTSFDDQFRIHPDDM